MNPRDEKWEPGRLPSPDELPSIEELQRTVPIEQLLYGHTLPSDGGEEWSYLDGPPPPDNPERIGRPADQKDR